MIQTQDNILTAQQTNPFAKKVELNKGGYVYERFDLKLQKLLACSNGDQVKDNLLWNEKQRYIAYSTANIVVIEQMN